MRILFISRWFPCPPDNGSKARVFNLLRQLSRRHEITLLSFVQEPISRESLATMQAYCRSVHTVRYREFNPRRLRALLGLFSRRPRSAVDTRSPEMEALVTEIGAQDHCDVVIASQIDCAPYALLLEHTPRVFEEIEVAAAYEQFARQHALFSRVRYGLTWWKLSRFLARLLRDFQGATVVSQQERELVEKIMPEYERVAIVPNGVDLEAYIGNFEPPAPDTLVYTGALTYSANLDAMEFFLREVFPLVKAQQPDVRLRITGRHEGVRLDRLPLGSGAELTGYVEDIRPVVAQSWACVVPLRLGGGTRLKILEAMALGTPVVSTSKGAEGIEVTPGEDILIADEPAEFAAAVLRLLSDRKLRDRLVSNGRRLVQVRYGWDRIGETLGRFLDQVVQDKRHPGAI